MATLLTLKLGYLLIRPAYHRRSARSITFFQLLQRHASIGFIAQEMEAIIPEVVSGDDGEKGIAYGLLTSVIVKAMQEQQQEIEQLRTENKKLKAEVAKVNLLEKQIASIMEKLDENDRSTQTSDEE